jgi:hypothetical protein
MSFLDLDLFFSVLLYFFLLYHISSIICRSCSSSLSLCNIHQFYSTFFYIPKQITLVILADLYAVSAKFMYVNACIFIAGLQWRGAVRIQLAGNSNQIVFAPVCAVCAYVIAYVSSFLC